MKVSYIRRVLQLSGLSLIIIILCLGFSVGLFYIFKNSLERNEVAHDWGGELRSLGIGTERDLEDVSTKKITYSSDFSDDMIVLFWENNAFKNPSQSKFDEYFSKLHDQGIKRLIIWPTPFSYFTDNDANYCENIDSTECKDWET